VHDRRLRGWRWDGFAMFTHCFDVHLNGFGKVRLNFFDRRAR
jgi:hypothetical protein